MAKSQKEKIKPMIRIVIFIALTLTMFSCKSGKHLFILSGQSNMVGLRTEESFAPMIEKEFGKKNVIIIKDAHGSQPIRRWVKDWKPIGLDTFTSKPDLYDTLMAKVYPAIAKKKISSATFIWMQGERDAREKLGNVYAKSLLGLHQQLMEDINVKDLNFVIGRLSDFDMKNEKYPDWIYMREVQVQVAQSDLRYAWVDTDDLNDGVNRERKTIKNDLHMSALGYKTLGERFAITAIKLIKDNRGRK
jgi:hypothetical protein